MYLTESGEVRFHVSVARCIAQTYWTGRCNTPTKQIQTRINTALQESLGIRQPRCCQQLNGIHLLGCLLAPARGPKRQLMFTGCAMAGDACVLDSPGSNGAILLKLYVPRNCPCPWEGAWRICLPIPAHMLHTRYERGTC